MTVSNQKYMTVSNQVGQPQTPQATPTVPPPLRKKRERVKKEKVAANQKEQTLAPAVPLEKPQAAVPLQRKVFRKRLSHDELAPLTTAALGAMDKIDPQARISISKKRAALQLGIRWLNCR